MLNHRRLPPRQRERRKKPSTVKQPHIRIGMTVVIKRSCGVEGCRRLDHRWDTYLYRGEVLQRCGDWWLVECDRGMGSHWVQRKDMFVRDHDGRTWSTPLLVVE